MGPKGCRDQQHHPLKHSRSTEIAVVLGSLCNALRGVLIPFHLPLCLPRELF